MRRFLLNFASVISLLLLVLLLILQFGNRGSMQCVVPTQMGFRAVSVFISDGRFCAGYICVEYGKLDKRNYPYGTRGLSYREWPWSFQYEIELNTIEKDVRFAGVRNVVEHWATPATTLIFSGFALPAWIVAIALCVLPSIWIAVTWNRSRARRRGCCKRCGYNLTGNTSGVCPECGKAVSARREVVH